MPDADASRSSGRNSSGTILAALGVACIVGGLWFRFGRDVEDGGEPRGAGETASGADGGPGASASSAPSAATRPMASRRDEDPSRPRPRLAASLETVDLGVIAQCAGVARASVTLTNSGSDPVKVVGWAVSCACIRVLEDPGLFVPPGDSVVIPFEVDPWGIGGKSARLDFRLDGNAIGPRIRIDYAVAGPLRTRPSVAIRPDIDQPMLIEVERCDPEGAHVAEEFEVLAVIPPVGIIYRVAEGEPPLDAGWGGFDLDYALIDELASAPDAASDPAFEWKDGPGGRRWKSLEIRVKTSHPECNELRMRVRNR